MPLSKSTPKISTNTPPTPGEWCLACDKAKEYVDNASDWLKAEVAVEVAEQLLAIARRASGDACERCGGLGKVTYPNTATWRGGAGGATPTVDVCDKCWGSGLTSRRGVDMRQLEASIASASLEGIANLILGRLEDKMTFVKPSLSFVADALEKYNASRLRTVPPGVSRVGVSLIYAELAKVMREVAEISKTR